MNKAIILIFSLILVVLITLNNWLNKLWTKTVNPSLYKEVIYELNNSSDFPNEIYEQASIVLYYDSSTNTKKSLLKAGAKDFLKSAS